jgi:Myb-like DNA-binding domain
VFTYALQKHRYIEDFKESDWLSIAEFIPTRDHHKCLKRWLFIQKLGGNKLQWSARED